VDFCVAVGISLEYPACRVTITGGKPPPAPTGRRIPCSTIRTFNLRLAHIHKEDYPPISDGLGGRAGPS